jgi:hypothetical protein
MDILVKARGKNFWVVPQTDSAREYLYNETGAIPHAWSVQLHEGEFLRLSKKDKDTYEFLDYLMNSEYTISREE